MKKNMNKNTGISEQVWPFLDWSLIQAGNIEFIENIYRDDKPPLRLPSPKFHDVPYGISIKQQKAEKTPSWLKAEKPWESMRINSYLTVIYENGTYRLWYDSLCFDSADTDYHNEYHSTKLCYAESLDGINWKKPALGLVEYEGNNQNNIVFDHKTKGGGYDGGTVFLDPVAPSSERYKLINLGWEKDKWVVRGAVSSDGLFWTPIAEPILDDYASDTQTVAYYDRQLATYVGYFRGKTTDGFSNSYSRRGIARAVTKDFRRWPIPETVLVPGINQHPSHDFYTNAHTLYPGRDDLHLMFPSQFDREKDSFEVYLATSRDGKMWEYFGNYPVVPLGEKGSGQEGIICAGCGLVPLGKDRFALPCCGFPITHGDYFPGAKDYAGGYFWATWKKDRLVAIEAPEKGAFSLPVLTLKAARLYLNLFTKPGGEISVQLSDEKGAPIPGHTFSDCKPITGDSLDHLVTWKADSDLTSLPEKPIVIQFRLRQAKIYSLQFRVR